MQPWLRSVLSKPLAPLRARSNRVVIQTPPSGVGIGNILYLLLWAHQLRMKGQEGYVTVTPTLSPWLETFPGLAELTVEHSRMRLLDQRVHGWNQAFDYVGREAIESFVCERLAGSALLAGQRPDGGHVTVNVRRGDYYSVERFRTVYGFNIAGYVRAALQGSNLQEPIRTIKIVSDDPLWCRDHLAFARDYGEVSFQDPADGAAENLRDLALSRRLILGNSTFSYWGGYISNALYGDNHSSVWVPAFHSRDTQHGGAIHLDPLWSAVNDPEGGWDPPAEDSLS